MAVWGHCECRRRKLKSEVAAVKETSRCQGQSWSMVGDLSAWRNLDLKVEVSCEVVDTGLVFEYLPWSSRCGIWNDEELLAGGGNGGWSRRWFS